MATRQEEYRNCFEALIEVGSLERLPNGDVRCTEQGLDHLTILAIKKAESDDAGFKHLEKAEQISRVRALIAKYKDVKILPDLLGMLSFEEGVARMGITFDPDPRSC